MTKWGWMVLSLLFLTACHPEGEAETPVEENEEDTATDSNEETEAIEEIEEDFQIYYFDNITTEKEEEGYQPLSPDPLAFTLQQSDEAIIGLENMDNIMDYLYHLDAHAREAGLLDDLEEGLSIEFIGGLDTVYPMESKDYFLLFNHSDETYVNFSFDVTVTSEEFGTIIDNQTTFLSEEIYGVLEPYSYSPVYIDFSEENYENLVHAQLSGDIQAELAQVEQDQAVPDEYANGYNPYYQSLMNDPDMDEAYLPFYRIQEFIEKPIELSDTQFNQIDRSLKRYLMTQIQPNTLDGSWAEFGFIKEERFFVPFVVINDTIDGYNEVEVTVGLQDRQGNEIVTEEHSINGETYTLQSRFEEITEGDAVFEMGSVVPIFVEIPREKMEDFLQAYHTDMLVDMFRVEETVLYEE